MDVLNHNLIRLGLTGAKALQTAIRFPRETRRRFADPRSNAFTRPAVTSGEETAYQGRDCEHTAFSKKFKEAFK